MNSKRIFPGIIILAAYLLMQVVALGQTPPKAQPKINFTSFTVSSNQRGILIDWATDNTVATNYFEIERSSDGIDFKTIELVFGSDPKQAGCDCYKGFDKPGSNTKKYFYRLKHVAIDGEIELSETKMLAINNYVLN